MNYANRDTDKTCLKQSSAARINARYYKNEYIVQFNLYQLFKWHINILRSLQ